MSKDDAEYQKGYKDGSRREKDKTIRVFGGAAGGALIGSACLGPVGAIGGGILGFVVGVWWNEECD